MGRRAATLAVAAGTACSQWCRTSCDPQPSTNPACTVWQGLSDRAQAAVDRRGPSAAAPDRSSPAPAQHSPTPRTPHRCGACRECWGRPCLSRVAEPLPPAGAAAPPPCRPPATATSRPVPQ